MAPLRNEHTKVCITGIYIKQFSFFDDNNNNIFSFAGERAISDIRLFHFNGNIKPRIK